MIEHLHLICIIVIIRISLKLTYFVHVLIQEHGLVHVELYFLNSTIHPYKFNPEGR